MKEVTYEEWLRNPTPRMMWVWDVNEEDKVRQKVVYVIKRGSCDYPIRTTKDDDTDYEAYRHCAEIEEPRRMTNRELSRWLREKPTREIKYCSNTYSNTICCFYTYVEEDAEQEAVEGILIREGDGDWREPLVEVEE